MINSLHIKNFQSHPDSFFEFSPGMNVFIGDSDVGKSAIRRALEWLIFNRPISDSFRSWWEGDTEVTVVTSEGNIITRIKQKSKNIYRLNDIEFTAFGTEVPEEIKQALNMDHINIQSQLSPHYLLTDSPGQVAQHFNKIAGIDLIDSATKRVQKWINSIEKDRDVQASKIEDAEEELTAFEYLEKFEIELEVLEGVESRKIGKIQKSNTLNRVITEVEGIDTQITAESSLIPMGPSVNDILTHFEKKELKDTQKSKLTGIIKDIEEIEQAIDDSQLLLPAKPTIDAILSGMEELNKKKDEHTRLIRLGKTIKRVTDELSELTLKIAKDRKKFETNMPDICPLCGESKTK